MVIRIIFVSQCELFKPNCHQYGARSENPPVTDNYAIVIVSELDQQSYQFLSQQLHDMRDVHVIHLQYILISLSDPGLMDP